MKAKRATVALAGTAAVLATYLGAWTGAESTPMLRASVASAAQEPTNRDWTDSTMHSRAPDRFRPEAGVSFNRPGSQEINAKVLRAIAHTPKDGKIR